MEALPQLIQQMLRAEFYPHPVAHLELIQTHISYVILTGAWAYKVKKPVNFGFLDFSTLENRGFYCQEELRLNQRLAPTVYETVLPITQIDGQYQLGGVGEPVEYTLRMHEFSQKGLFSELFDQNAVTLEQMTTLGKILATFHQKALVNDHILSFGSPEQVRYPIDQNYIQTVGFIGRAQQQDWFDQTKAFTDRFYDEHPQLFQQRVLDQRIREGHGDLHLGNIAVIDGAPVIFDCIEFNEPFRFIDVLSDTAFLMMDLIARKRPDLGNRFLNTYLEGTGDWGGLPLLPLYLSYRAYVRGKVNSFVLDSETVGPEQKAEAQSIAEGYYRLAWEFTQPKTGQLFIMQGVSGSGKSTLGQQLALQTQGIQIRADAVRKHLAGYPLTERLPDHFYTPAFSQQVYQKLYDLAALLLPLGFTVILDAKYDRADQRLPLLALAQGLQLPARILACRIAESELRTRLVNRQGDIADATVDLLPQQLAAQQDFTAEEEAQVVLINTAGAKEDLSTVVRMILGATA